MGLSHRCNPLGTGCSAGPQGHKSCQQTFSSVNLHGLPHHGLPYGLQGICSCSWTHFFFIWVSAGLFLSQLPPVLPQLLQNTFYIFLDTFPERHHRHPLRGSFESGGNAVPGMACEACSPQLPCSPWVPAPSTILCTWAAKIHDVLHCNCSIQRAPRAESSTFC